MYGTDKSEFSAVVADGLAPFVGALEIRAAQSIKKEQDDYIGDDGLLHCGKCKEKKQTRIIILGEERTPMCLCKCGEAKREKNMTVIRVAKLDQDFDNYSRNATDFELLEWIDSRDYKISEKLVRERKRLLKKNLQLLKREKY